MADRWRITFDDGGACEDEFNQRPSEFEFRQCQRAAPDTPTRLYLLRDGWRSELIEERPPLRARLAREDADG